jgi:hypothetical protein
VRTEKFSRQHFKTSDLIDATIVNCTPDMQKAFHQLQVASSVAENIIITCRPQMKGSLLFGKTC